MNLATLISSRIKVVLIAVGAILLYGFISGIRANVSILTEAIADFTGLSYGSVAIAFSVMNLVLALSTIVFGILSLRIRKFHILLIGAIASCIAFVGASFFPSMLGLIIFLGFFLGVGASALCYAIVFAAAEPFIAKKYVPIFSGILVASQGIFGTILSPALNGTIDTFGLTSCLQLISFVALCMIPFIFLFIQKKNADQVHESQPRNQPQKISSVLKKMLTHPFFYLVGFASLIYGIGDGGFMNHTAEYYSNVGLSAEFTTTVVSVYCFSIIVGGILGGLICTKWKNYYLNLGVIFSIWIVLSFTSGYIVLMVSDMPEVCLVLSIISAFISGTLINTSMPIIAAMVGVRVSPMVLAMGLIVMEVFMKVGYAFDNYIGGLCYDMFGVFYPVDLLAYTVALVGAIVFLTQGINLKRNMTKEDIII